MPRILRGAQSQMPETLFCPCGFGFALTIATCTKKPVIVKNQFELMLRANPFLHFFDFAALEFDDLAAAHADHVVMMALSAHRFIKLTFPLAHGFLDHTAFKEERNGAVNCVARNAKALFLETLIKAVGIKMVFQTADFLKDVAALKRVFEPPVHGKGLEMFFVVACFMGHDF